MTVQVNVGTESIRNYKRLSYSVWYALGEFIDNSTQSYFDHRDELDAAKSDTSAASLEVRVVYDKDRGLLRVTDNAYGMSLENLNDALQIARPPANTSGRSEFGMGLKTAACWLGDEWSIRTKQFGNDEEYEITFNVEDVAAGNTTLTPKVTKKDSGLHYTVVEIRDMHQKLASRTIGKTKNYLRSMYRVDVRDGLMNLFWDQERLTYDESLDVLRASNDEPYQKNFAFHVGDRNVTGWVAVLASGGRPKAGFAIVRRGRVIEGQPTAWRPSEIFGQEQGTNNLVNQRIVGEIHLDEFMVSHTKNAILWQGDEEDVIERELRDRVSDYIHVANQARRGTRPATGPSRLEVDAAVDELKMEMEQAELIDLVEVDDVPPVDVVKAAIDPVVSSTVGQTPDISVQVGPALVRVYLSKDTSPNDPYFASDYVTDDITVVVNTAHPYWSKLSGAEGVLNFLRDCVFDALAEWKCTKKRGEIQPDTVKIIKDSYMRLDITTITS